MQVELQRDVRERSRRDVEPPGSGRLGLVTGYFQFAGACGVFAMAAITMMLIVPGSPVEKTNFNPLALGAMAFYTAGFFRTAHLLEQRRRSGAGLAAVCFAGPLLGYLSGVAPSLSSLVLASTGLALIASVWRHLD